MKNVNDNVNVVIDEVMDVASNIYMKEEVEVVEEEMSVEEFMKLYNESVFDNATKAFN